MAVAGAARDLAVEQACREAEERAAPAAEARAVQVVAVGYRDRVFGILAQAVREPAAARAEVLEARRDRAALVLAGASPAAEQVRARAADAAVAGGTEVGNGHALDRRLRQ